MARKRVIAWGTGSIGMPGLRILIGHPEYELVGLHAWSPDKVGRDAGEIAGMENTGVIATDNIDELLALNADCLVYNGNYAQREAICVGDVARFLERGTNVVTPALMDLIAPKFGRPQFVDPIRQACEAGKTSIFCGGTDPGYMTTGLLFSLLCGAGRVDRVHVAEICSLNGYGSYTAIEHWGFNHPLDYRAPMFYEDMGSGWHESTIRGIADFLGVELDEIQQTYETAGVDFDYDAKWGRGRANTIAAVRWTMSGMYKGEPLVVYKKIERTHEAAAPDWEQPANGQEAGYRVGVIGEPSICVETGITLYDGCAITALHPINAINEVCAAKPGILGQLDMPHFFSRYIRRAHAA